MTSALDSDDKTLSITRNEVVTSAACRYCRKPLAPEGQMW